MTKQVRGTFAIATVAVIAIAGAALAESVKIGPVKGSTYAGVVKGETITLRVAKGGSVKVTLPNAPAYCQGGSGPAKQHTKSVPNPRTHQLTAKISYTAVGSSHVFAKVTIKGYFDTFGTATPVFQGTVKSTFTANGSRGCDGQESFEATKL
jgi:hypothetical protein